MPRMRIAAAAAALVAFCSSAAAQDWPTRPVTMVVPFAAGGAFDVLARVFAPYLSMSLGQQVIVENVGAAAGIVGTNRVAPAVANAELLAAALPHARLVMLAGCGHLPEVKFPSCVNDLIAAHLS